jgi:hypothetical protein
VYVVLNLLFPYRFNGSVVERSCTEEQISEEKKV